MPREIPRILIRGDFNHHYFRSWGVYLTGHGGRNTAIAGMKIDDFQKTLNFFNMLNVTFMYISSCYAGGENVKYSFDKEKIKQVLRYPIAIASIMDSVKMTQTSISDKSADYIGFFNALNDRDSVSYSEWLQKVLRNLSLMNNWFSSQYGLAAIPQVLMPRVDWFSAIGVDEAILILHKVKAESAHKSGFLDIKGKLGVVVDPDVIYPTLRIESRRSDVIPMWLDLFKGLPVSQDSLSDKSEYLFYPIFIPRKATTGKVTTYIFTRIELDPFEEEEQLGLLHFIRNSLLNTQGRVTTCCFSIKELVGFNDGIIEGGPQEKITLKNVDIRTQEISNHFTTKKNIVDFRISFNYQEAAWLLELKYEHGSDSPGKWDFKKRMKTPPPPVAVRKKVEVQDVKKTEKKISSPVAPRKKPSDDSVINAQLDAKQEVLNNQSSSKKTPPPVAPRKDKINLVGAVE